jgi:uncharacterized protein YndB with AHSA1/START domain
MVGRTLTIVQQHYLAATPATVFEALTTSRGLSRWFLESAEIEPKAGTEYTFTWQGGYHHSARVLAAVPGRRLVLAWPNRLGRQTKMTAVAFSLRKKGRGTLLTLRHEGYPRSGGWLEIYGSTQSGWAYFLTNLKSVLATGRDLRSDDDAV